MGFRAVGLLDRTGIRVGFVFGQVVAELVCVAGRGEPFREHGIGVIEVHLVTHLVAEAVKDRDVGEVPAEITLVGPRIRAVTGGRLHLELTWPVAGVAIRVVVGRGVDQGDLCTSDMFFDAVFDRSAIPGGLPVHPDVPVYRSEGIGDAGRYPYATHPVVPPAGF